MRDQVEPVVTSRPTGRLPPTAFSAPVDAVIGTSIPGRRGPRRRGLRGPGGGGADPPGFAAPCTSPTYPALASDPTLLVADGSCRTSVSR